MEGWVVTNWTMFLVGVVLGILLGLVYVVIRQKYDDYQEFCQETKNNPLLLQFLKYMWGKND